MLATTCARPSGGGVTLSTIVTALSRPPEGDGDPTVIEQPLLRLGANAGPTYLDCFKSEV